MIHLEVKSDGFIYLIKDCPEEHFSKGCHCELQCESESLTFSEQFCGCYNNYQQALASCERILCADQEKAKRLIWKEKTGLPFSNPTYFKPSIYSIPNVEWERVNYCTASCCPDKCLRPQWKAELKESTPSTEQESQELSKSDLQETQEAMWNYVDFIINDSALPPRSWSRKRKQLITEFTITRKP